MNKKNNLPEDEMDESYASGRVSDWVKKTLMTGIGAVFMTEEGVRNALSDMKLPKNVIAAAVSQADKTKREVTEIVAKEIRNFLDKIEVDEIIKRALASSKIEFTASVRFVPIDEDKKKAAPKKSTARKKRT